MMQTQYEQMIDAIDNEDVESVRSLVSLRPQELVAVLDYAFSKLVYHVCGFNIWRPCYYFMSRFYRIYSIIRWRLMQNYNCRDLTIDLVNTDKVELYEYLLATDSISTYGIYFYIPLYEHAASLRMKRVIEKIIFRKYISPLDVGTIIENEAYGLYESLLRHTKSVKYVRTLMYRRNSKALQVLRGMDIFSDADILRAAKNESDIEWLLKNGLSLDSTRAYTSWPF